MNPINRCDRNLLTIKRTIDNNYDKLKTIGVFYLEKNAVLSEIAKYPPEEIARIADECREMGVRWRMFAKTLGKFESAVLDGVEIADLSASEEKIPGADGLISVYPVLDGVQISFAVDGTFHVLGKMNRNGKYEIDGVHVTPETRFTVVNELLPFWEDRYSVALRSADGENRWYAISVEDPKTGKKGSACVKLYVRCGNRLWMDDLAKYVDCSELLRWINP